MTLGEKIYRLRTEKGLSQEAFGEALDVSRQSVSKWETDQSLPEIEKVVAISDFFGVSTDYLLKENIQDSGLPSSESVSSGNVVLVRGVFHYEYKSKRSWKGLPLVHICLGFKLKKARGVIAIGNIAQGIISLGLVSIGVIALGPLAVGLLAIGAAAFGGIAAGSIAVGLITFGAVSFGLFSTGAVAIGQFSFGALARGRQVAVGDAAYGKIALGFSEVSGEIFGEIRNADGSFSYQEMVNAIDQNVANYWYPFKQVMKWILSLMNR